jgi:hypothetical protein
METATIPNRSFFNYPEGTIFVSSMNRTFRNYRSFMRHFRDLAHIVLIPELFVGVNSKL